MDTRRVLRVAGLGVLFAVMTASLPCSARAADCGGGNPYSQSYVPCPGEGNPYSPTYQPPSGVGNPYAPYYVPPSGVGNPYAPYYQPSRPSGNPYTPYYQPSRPSGDLDLYLQYLQRWLFSE